MKTRASSPVQIPDWARDAVWYQIFPERFRNGDRRSDPRLTYITDRKIKGWRTSPWGQDWYRQEPWEKGLGDFFKSVYYRRFGGDLAGVREKLGYLRDLGVTAIYLNPVFMAPSLHKYDAASMHHIDPTFGPDHDGDLRAIARAKETEDPATWIWTKADRYFIDLVADIHRHGMRVIIDGVFNHTGRGFFAFQDLFQHGRKSRYRNWYRIKTWNKDGTFDYDGWFGHKQLPEFARGKDDLARPVREYIFNVTDRWMIAGGIDGWRLDVAFCVPHGFWKKWRTHVKKLNPDAYLTAEIVARADDYLRGDEFDAVMNYMWLYPTVSFFSPGGSPISATEFRKKLNELLKAYPNDVNYVVQNLLDSHDVGRVATMLENHSLPINTFEDYFNASRVNHNRDLVTTRPGARAFASLRQMIVFQMAYLGAPMLYYGTEVGMWGANDPCDRQPMLWSDIKHEPESNTITGPCKPRARKVDRALFRFCRQAISLRTAHPALRRGTIRWHATSNERLLAFTRSLGSENILVLLNAGEHPASFKLDRPGRDLWSHKPVRKGRITIDPRGWRVIAL